jgi:hypothetical protein
MCLKGTYSKVLMGKNLSDTFPIKRIWNNEMFIAIAFQLPLIYTFREVQEN